MNKKGLIAILIILVGGIFLNNYRDVFIEKKQGVPVATDNITKNIPYCSEEITRILASSFSDVVKTVSPSLVNISAVHIVEVQTPFHRFHFDDFFGDFFNRPRRQRPEPETRKHRHEGTGSGFIVDPRGYVLTNYHVIKDAEEIKIITYDDKVYDAEVVGKDPRTDLAVIRIKSSKIFPALELGNSDKVKIGDWVMAGGSPFGLRQTFTAGIISASRQNINVGEMVYRNMLQTDAAINRGNSGGPLVDLAGRVIGINTAIFAPTGVFAGIGFAIPVNQAKLVLSDLIEKGRVVRGWLGVEIKDVDEAIKKHFGLKEAKGVLINRVFKDSEAEKGGLQRGDVIIKFNEVKIENIRELQDKVAASKPGSNIMLTIIRKKSEKVIEIKLGEMPEKFPSISKREPEKPADEKNIVIWKGIEVSNITGLIKERYNLTVDKGVVVVSLDPAEKGYEIGLRTGDVIVEFNKKEIKNIEDFNEVSKIASIKDGIVFDIIRAGRSIFISYQKSN